MNRIIISLLMVFINLNGFCQSIISNDMSNTVLLGIANPISVLAKNTDCEKLVLKTNNGKITTYKSCDYVWAPAHLGEGTLTLFKIKRKDTIFYGSKMFHVVPVSLVIKLYGSINDSISVKNLVNVTNPIIYPVFEATHCGINITASQYSIIAKRGNETLFSIDNIGMPFTRETLVLLQILQKGDILLFFDFRPHNAAIHHLNISQQFVITE